MLWSTCQSAFACTPPRSYTLYFGELDGVTEELEARILKDVRKTGTRTFEDTSDELHHAIMIRKNRLYINGQMTDQDARSFRYLGKGYYRVNGTLYYKGNTLGPYPVNGVVKTFDVNESVEGVPRPGMMTCGAARTGHVLEVSDGRHFEQIEYDGFRFPREK